MKAALFMGIDGGGSSLRVAIVDANLNELISLRAGAVNPSVIGRARAYERIHAGIDEALRTASLRPECIVAVGIGIAGASDSHSRDWLLELVQSALPLSYAAASSDLEIALVGALGRRDGLLLLAGTGSAAYAVTPAGQRLQVGGWGYLLGDEGSSYWIGSQLLGHITSAYDAGGQHSLTETGRACLDQLGLCQARELVSWVYQSDEAPAARIASLAPFVVARAETGDKQAQVILRDAAKHLVDLVETAKRRLSLAEARIGFAGGLLDHDNWLADEVARRLGLSQRPVAKYPPVIGAAQLAKLEWSERKKL